jgi:Tfp pilus assembly protein PilX
MMKIMSILRSEEGSIMVITLLVLTILTLIGIGANDTTTTDIQIAANEKFYKMAFYHADGGIYSTPKLISEALEAGANPSGTSFSYLDAGADALFDELMGYEDNDADTDVSFSLGGQNVNVDLQRGDSENLSGGEADFPSGTVAGFYTNFNLDSFGNGPNNTTCNVGATYRKVFVPGGL